MLVLLVIFMATAPLLMQGVEVDLPKANSTPVSDSDAEPLIVSIDAEARLYLNLGASDDQALSIETVRQRVATVLKRNPDKAVMVWGDARVPYGEVVSLMSELQSAGAPSVGLVTEAPASRQ
jgi:biopolymer transport protein TolR